MGKKLLKWIYTLVGLGALGAVAGIVIIIIFNLTLPSVSTLSEYRPSTPSKILSKDGTLLAELGKERRFVVPIEEIPKTIIDSVISAEDSGFYEHAGVEFWGLFRAFLVNLKEARYAQGGSTITQQVAKSLLLSNERSITRKIKDILLAIKIEKSFSKKEILHLYLNQVYLGGGYYGVKAAFQGYFDKELSEATIAEAAMVAGLLVAPGKYSPYINPKRAKIRQGYVLGRMYETGRITKEQYDEAVNEETKFRIRKSRNFLAGHFTDWVRQRVQALVGEKEILNEGFTVKTTLDYELQQVAEREVRKVVESIDRRQGYNGPLEKIEKEKRLEWLQEQRAVMLKESSEYFTIKESNEKKYELEDDLEYWVKREERIKEFNDIVRNGRFLPGNDKSDLVLKTLNKDEKYRAMVTGVDDRARVVYVNIAGVSGIVPYSGFNWIHERKVSTERNYYSLLTKPSSFIKVGDVVHVSLIDESVRLRGNVQKSFVSEKMAKLKKEVLREVNKQVYLEFEITQEPKAEGALVSVDPFSGEVVSMVGGYDFQRSQFNRALQSKRQPGSSFKPLLYAAALENGYTPASIIIDSPETLGGAEQSLNWKPRNYDGKFKGPVTFRNSLEQSRNVTTIKIASDLGVDRVVNFTDRIGFNAELDKDLSLALGSFGVTLVDIVSTYAVFPNGGLKLSPTSILTIHNREGEEVSFDEKSIDLKVKEEEKKEIIAKEESVLEEESVVEKTDEEKEKEIKNRYVDFLKGDQVYDRRLAYIMTNLLRGVVLHGTGRGTKSVSSYLGGKTGTTNNYVDAWFIGFSPKLATGVWTGLDDNGTLGWGETGAKSALPAWREFMRASIRKYGESEFMTPLGIVNVKIDKETGKEIKDQRKAGFLEAFVEGDLPGQSKADKDVEFSDNIILEEDDYYNNQ